MVSIITSVAPICYPLSESMVRLLAEERQIPSKLTISLELDITSSSLEDQINDLKHQLLRQWDPLIQEIADLRARAEEPLKSALEGYEKLSTKEFIEYLSQKTPQVKEGKIKISGMTVSRWRGRGFIRAVDESDDYIAAETALAVLMMRMADTRHQKGWLPAGFHTNEPYMYVWRKDGPEKPAIPCGLPLSKEIPNHAFLFTPFRFLGLLYPDYWFPFGDLGSVRFAGITKGNKKVFWNLTEDELHIWDPSLQPLARDISDAFALQVRDNLANLVLLRLATEQFQCQKVSS